MNRLIIILLSSSIVLLCFSCNHSYEYSKSSWTEKDRAKLVDQLESTHEELIKSVNLLTDDQWNYLPMDGSWSIAQIVEHLGLQQDMHYREVYVLSKSPPHPELVEIVKGTDEIILNYKSDTTRGRATWNVEPLGRWCNKEDALGHFNFVRGKFIEFVTKTDADLKQHFTFRTLADKSDFRNVRDLHQIILTTAAHTSRHVKQIENIKLSNQFPK